jgi:hypothetical protein
MHRTSRTVCANLINGIEHTLDNQNQSNDTQAGVLTVRTEFADGRVSAILDVPDGPPTWVQIFASIQKAANFAAENNLEFIDNVSAHDKPEEC